MGPVNPSFNPSCVESTEAGSDLITMTTVRTFMTPPALASLDRDREPVGLRALEAVPPASGQALDQPPFRGLPEPPLASTST